jgi:hypothetical protein
MATIKVDQILDRGPHAGNRRRSVRELVNRRAGQTIRLSLEAPRAVGELRADP